MFTILGNSKNFQKEEFTKEKFTCISTNNDHIVAQVTSLQDFVKTLHQNSMRSKTFFPQHIIFLKYFSLVSIFFVCRFGFKIFISVFLSNISLKYFSLLTLLSRFPGKIFISYGLEPSLCLLIESTPLLCMWALAGERSIYLTRVPFTCGHIGQAFWPCPIKGRRCGYEFI